MGFEDKYFYASLVFLALAFVTTIPYILLSFMKLRAASKSARSGLLWIRTSTLMAGVWIAVWLVELSIATHVQTAGPTPHALRSSLYHLEGVKTLVGIATFASIVYTELELVITLEDTEQTALYRYVCMGIYAVCMVLNMARFAVYEVAGAKIADADNLASVSDILGVVVCALIAVFAIVGLVALVLYRVILHKTDFIVLALAYTLTLVRQLISIGMAFLDNDGHRADELPLDEGNWRRLVEVLIIGWSVVASVAMVYTVVAKNTDAQQYDGASDTASLQSGASNDRLFKSPNCKDSVTWQSFSPAALEQFKADVARNSMNRAARSAKRRSMLRESTSHHDSMPPPPVPKRDSLHHMMIKS